MIDPPRITNTKSQASAVIRLAIAHSDMRKFVGPASAWYIYVHARDAATMDFDVGVPVTDPVKPTGRVKPGLLPAARVARTIYQGPYEGMHAAWAEFDAWIAKNGHKPAGPHWDVYLAGPETGSDSSKWRTELNRSLLP